VLADADGTLSEVATTDIPEGGSVSEPDLPVQLTTSEALLKIASMSATIDASFPVESTTNTDTTTDLAPIASTEGMTYCPECYLPLHPDPKPERLYIFLHALRYTTSLGCFETEMPEWAAEGWEWDRS
jgi:tRNA pseudouridine32 synthase